MESSQQSQSSVLLVITNKGNQEQPKVSLQHCSRADRTMDFCNPQEKQLYELP